MKLSEVFKALEEGKTVVEKRGNDLDRFCRICEFNRDEEKFFTFISWWKDGIPEIDEIFLVNLKLKYSIKEG